jgi:hypothetical protein
MVDKIADPLSTFDPVVRKDVSKLLAKGGHLYAVHWYRQRYHSWHFFLETARGHVLFPNHALCTPYAMVAETELTNVDLFSDACFAVALFLAEPGLHRLSNVPFGRASNERGYRRRSWRSQYGGNYVMSTEEQKWWSPETSTFLRNLRSLRVSRPIAREVTDPVTMGIPFCECVEWRAGSVLRNLNAIINEKIRITTAGVNRRTIQQISSYQAPRSKYAARVIT